MIACSLIKPEESSKKQEPHEHRGEQSLDATAAPGKLAWGKGEKATKPRTGPTELNQGGRPEG